MATSILNVLLLLLCVLPLCSSGSLVVSTLDAWRNGGTMAFLTRNKVTSSKIHVSIVHHKVWDTVTTSWFKDCLPHLPPYIKSTSIIISFSRYNSSRKPLNELLSNFDTIHSALQAFNLNLQAKVTIPLQLSGHTKKCTLYILVKTETDEEMRVGDNIISLMIEITKHASSFLSYNDVPMIMDIKRYAVPNGVEVAQFTKQMIRSIESQKRLEGEVSGILAPTKGTVMNSSHRKLLHNTKKSISLTKTSIHDTLDPPTTVFPPANPITNPVTTPATTPATYPYMNPTPAIVTVPPVNPVIVTPINPANTPVTIPPAIPITVPTINPFNPPNTVPTTTPVINPVTTYPFPPPGNIPVMTPVTTPVMNPVTPSVTGSLPTGPGQTWCVATTGALETALQAALDYACGIGGADCSAIQQTGSCYNPNSIESHASYAFNSYYQKNPVPSSCNFGGTATIVTTNPSTGLCIYSSYASPSSSGTSSGMPLSVLNPSNPAAATTNNFGTGLPPNHSATSLSFAAKLGPVFPAIVLAGSFVTGRLATYM